MKITEEPNIKKIGMEMNIRIVTTSKKKMFDILILVTYFLNVNIHLISGVPIIPSPDREDEKEFCARRMNDFSVNIAKNAANEAKAAQHAQNPAAFQASHQVREKLAKKAIKAAKTVETVLVGKVALVEELIREKEAVKIVLQEEVNNKIQLEQAIRETIKSIESVYTLINILKIGFNMAEVAANNANTVVKGVQRELKEKNYLLQQALRAVDALAKDEEMARKNFHETKSAVGEAMRYAAEAKNNVMRNKRQDHLENVTHYIRNVFPSA